MHPCSRSPARHEWRQRSPVQVFQRADAVETGLLIDRPMRGGHAASVPLPATTAQIPGGAGRSVSSFGIGLPDGGSNIMTTGVGVRWR